MCKEFISAQDLSNPGVLLLSEFAGAAEELGDGPIIINPYDIDGLMNSIKAALEMGDEEKRGRMLKLQKEVRENDIFKWTYGIFRSFKELIPIENAMREKKLYRLG